MTHHPEKFIDLCCGIGGFHQALSNMGMQCVFASDIDKDCQETYEKNYGIKPAGDFSKINVKDIPSFDVLCAGFPCQPFSKAGFQNGFDDHRGNIFFDICHIVEYHRPTYLILENVRNLSSHDKGNTWTIIRNKIDEMGYHVYDNPLILNTLYFGVPQSRERVVILAKLKDIGSLPELPEIGKFRNMSTTLTDIIEDPEFIVDKYRLTGKLKVAHTVWSDFINVLYSNDIDVPKFPIWTDWWDSNGNGTAVTKKDPKKSDEENKAFVQKKQNDFFEKYKNWIEKNRIFYQSHHVILEPWLETSRRIPEWTGALRKFEWQVGDERLMLNELLWSPRGSGVRVKKIDYSPTLVAMASMIPVFGPQMRQLTPRECARLQSFPDEFHVHSEDKVAYKQFGNAVNVVMVERCARFLINGEELFV